MLPPQTDALDCYLYCNISLLNISTHVINTNNDRKDVGRKHMEKSRDHPSLMTTIVHPWPTCGQHVARWMCAQPVANIWLTSGKCSANVWPMSGRGLLVHIGLISLPHKHPCNVISHHWEWHINKHFPLLLLIKSYSYLWLGFTARTSFELITLIGSLSWMEKKKIQI